MGDFQLVGVSVETPLCNPLEPSDVEVRRENTHFFLLKATGEEFNNFLLHIHFQSVTWSSF